jgi:acetyl esterase/lipase
MPIGQVREAFANLWTPALTGDPVEVRKVEDRALGRVNARLFLPDGPANPAILMYFHGGAT